MIGVPYDTRHTVRKSHCVNVRPTNKRAQASRGDAPLSLAVAHRKPFIVILYAAEWVVRSACDRDELSKVFQSLP